MIGGRALTGLSLCSPAALIIATTGIILASAVGKFTLTGGVKQDETLTDNTSDQDDEDTHSVIQHLQSG